MLQRFRSNIQQHSLFSKQQRLLLAFSGGIDSVVLAHLLHREGYTFSLAHCNFRLRGEESEADETFCKAMASQLGVHLHTEPFDVPAYAKEHKRSVQMAARELRYSWFEKLKAQHGYDLLLTAHHADDAIETFFVNLVRGSGLHGLKGIPMLQRDIARPLLFAFKHEIEAYAAEHELLYRNDSSNAEVKYKRNYLRHEVLPRFLELNPSFGNTMLQNMAYLQESEQIVRQFCETRYGSMCTHEQGVLRINAELLRKEPARLTLLHQWLQPMGFNTSQLQDILSSLDHSAETGKRFITSSHRLITGRHELLIEPLPAAREITTYSIRDLHDTSHLPVSLSFRISGEPEAFGHKHLAQLDAGLVSFPLTLRRWQDGDTFKPLGMKGFKKLSDFFGDEKMNLSEREQAWVLVSREDIIWLVNHRIDDRYKLTEKTTQVLKITYI